MKYKRGQTVKVKNGVLCPDDSEFNLSGWTGRIIELDEDDEPAARPAAVRSHRNENEPTSPFLPIPRRVSLALTSLFLLCLRLDQAGGNNRFQGRKRVLEEDGTSQ